MSPSTHPTSAPLADSADTACAAWFDAHNHLHDPRLEGNRADIIAAQRAVGIVGCVVNATCEEDWPHVATLTRRFPDFIKPAFGIHPWKAHTAQTGWQERLLAMLDEFPSASIGECGIDSWIDTPSLDDQIPVFLDHLRLARESDRFLTIHCLKAWGRLFDCFAIQAPPARFLMHSYGGSMETANRLLPFGAYFSFSGHFLHERKNAALDVFRSLPPQRILLETDAPDMTPPASFITHPLPRDINHPANLAAIGTALAARLGLPATALSHILTENSRQCFGTI